MSEYYDEKPFSYADPPKNSEDEFFGEGWSVRKTKDEFFFLYICGGLAGKHNEIKISEADYNLARSGEIGFDDLCTKYKVS